MRVNYKFYIGTRVYLGRDCIKNNISEFEKCGKRAVIITGRHSGKASGALDDVVDILNSANIEYTVFDNIENNPSLDNVKAAGQCAREFKADFVIGIGGGSPLDAAKAAAVLAVNAIEPADLFKNVFTIKPLPVIAIPTTAGSGSEVTPYCVLTRTDMQTKMSFGNEDTFPKAAFIDARYTESLSRDTTVNTAVDALSHAVEGYLSRRSTPVSDILALEAIDIFGQCTDKLLDGEFDFETREKLLHMSMLGGMVIAHTGTTIVHGMGYSLTYFKDIPHGRANGVLMKEYLDYNYSAAGRRIDNILRLLGVKSTGEFGVIIKKLLPLDIKLSEEELRLYASLTMKQRSTASNARNVQEEDLVKIIETSLR